MRRPTGPQCTSERLESRQGGRMTLMKVAPAPVKEFDRFFDRLFNTPLWPLPTGRATGETLWEPALDFSENPKEYLVRLEIPGVSRDDLDVNLNGNFLTLSG